MKSGSIFSNNTLCHKVPFTIYCDFESYIVPIDMALNYLGTSHSAQIKLLCAKFNCT